MGKSLKNISSVQRRRKPISFEDVREICSRMNIIESVCHEVMAELRRHIKFQKTFGNITTDFEKNYCAYSIYSVCRKNRSPLSLSQICYNVGASYRRVWAIIKANNSFLSSQPISPIEVLDGSVRSLSICGEEKEAIIKEIEHCNNFLLFSPLTVASCCTHRIISKRKNKPPSLSHICRVMGSSIGSVYRLREAIKR